MKFTLWMLMKILEPFDPVIYIQSEELRTIETVRLYASESDTPNVPMSEKILYVAESTQFFPGQSSRIICYHNSNYILLQTNDIYRVFNHILNYFDKMQSWYFALGTMISGHCLLKDVLNHFSEVLTRPLMVLDASQIVLASSENYGKGTIDERWDRMLDTGSFGLDMIEEYNRLHQAETQRKDAYLIPANPFPFPSFNRNIFLENEFVGFISIIIKGSSLEQDEKDWYEIVCESVFSWFDLYADTTELITKKSLFTGLLEGDVSEKQRMEDALNALGWEKDASKRLYVFSCISNLVNMNQHITRILNQHPETVYAITNENLILVLLNEDSQTRNFVSYTFTPLLKNSGYYGGSSNVFTNLADLKDQFELAKIAMINGQAIPGQIYACHDFVLPYVFSVLQKNMKLELCHPALLQLIEYDDAHRTDHYKVLYAFLKNNCNQTKAAHVIGMHRNSLIRKINFIQEYCGLDLEDYETRLHLMLSYEYRENA
ncbi:MAG: helix-turn-helix domain-containing protein [Eubacterium sp.]|nr:helix-turn-helix domain-containing protein [Eubacterium sp.]